MKQMIWNIFWQQFLISDGHISNGEYRKFGDIRFIINAFRIFGVFHRILRKVYRNTLNIFYCRYLYK